MKNGYSLSTGKRSLNPVGVAGSPDERGAYRIYGLAPGDYYISVTNATPSSDGGRDLHEDLVRAAALVPDGFRWDGRIEASEPWPDDPGTLVEPLAAGLDHAIRAGIAEGPAQTPFLVEVRHHDGDRLAFPPRALVVEARWRDRMRRSSAQDGAALQSPWESVAAGAGHWLALVDRLDEPALHACRVLNSARGGHEVGKRVADRLAELLQATPIPGTADPFGVLVHSLNRYGDRSPLARVRDRERFLASVTSTKPKRRGKPPEAALTDGDGALSVESSSGWAGARPHVVRVPVGRHRDTVRKKAALDAILEGLR